MKKRKEGLLFQRLNVTGMPYPDVVSLTAASRSGDVERVVKLYLYCTSDQDPYVPGTVDVVGVGVGIIGTTENARRHPHYSPTNYRTRIQPLDQFYSRPRLSGQLCNEGPDLLLWISSTGIKAFF